jgi:hypothetical protein
MLEASRHLLPYKVASDIVYTMVYYRQPILFYFSLFSLLPLKFTLVIQIFKDIFSFSDIWTLILIFYFLFFILGSCAKFQFVFNFIIRSIIVIC